MIEGCSSPLPSVWSFGVLWSTLQEIIWILKDRFHIFLGSTTVSNRRKVVTNVCIKHKYIYFKNWDTIFKFKLQKVSMILINWAKSIKNLNRLVFSVRDVNRVNSTWWIDPTKELKLLFCKHYFTVCNTVREVRGSLCHSEL